MVGWDDDDDEEDGDYDDEAEEEEEEEVMVVIKFMMGIITACMLGDGLPLQLLQHEREVSQDLFSKPVSFCPCLFNSYKQRSGFVHLIFVSQTLSGKCHSHWQ